MAENYTYTTLTRDESEPMYTFAEIKYGKIVSINQHWVPLSEYRKFFNAASQFIDITGVLVNGEAPQVGDAVDGGQIIHVKSIYSMAEIQALQVERLKLLRNQKELEPVEYNGHNFDADKDALMRMDKARQMLVDNNLENIEWTTADNERVAVTADDFKGINTAIAVRSNMLHTRYNELKTYIYNLDEKYISEVANIDWDYDTTKEPEVTADGGTNE